MIIQERERAVLRNGSQPEREFDQIDGQRVVINSLLEVEITDGVLLQKWMVFWIEKAATFSGGLPSLMMVNSACNCAQSVANGKSTDVQQRLVELPAFVLSQRGLVMVEHVIGSLRAIRRFQGRLELKRMARRRKTGLIQSSSVCASLSLGLYAAKSC